MKLLDDYFELQEKIYEYFGYQEDWVVIPLNDLTDQYWMIVGTEEHGKIAYSPKPFTAELIKEGKDLYGDIIYTQRFLPKWVYRGEEYTMVCADTRTDGNKFLHIVTNKLECTDQEMKDAYNASWGSLDT